MDVDFYRESLYNFFKARACTEGTNMKQKFALPLFLCAMAVLASCANPVSTGTPASVPTPSATAIPPTFTPTPIPQLTVNQSVECRTGPSTDYDVVASYEPGQQVDLAGRNNDQSFWIVRNESGRECWIEAQAASVSLGGTGSLPELTPPPVPTPAPPAAPSGISGSYVCEPIIKKSPYGPVGAPGDNSNFLRVGTDILITITWQDNADDESNYQILKGREGHAVLPPDTTEFRETISYSTVTINAGFLYAVLAFNDIGSSSKIELTITASCR